MPVYQYEAMDAQGVEIKDEIEALSQKEATSKIRNMGYFPTKIAVRGARKAAAVRTVRVAKKRRGAGGKVKVKIVTQFARQLSTLQDAGLPILRSLRILEEQQKSGNFKRIVGYVADDIEGGSTLSEAMGKSPKAFDRLFVNMVAAGETGGVLDLILARVAEFMEKAQKLKSRVKSAMIYPTFVISAALGIVLGLMTFVIPSFSTVLLVMGGGADMPMLTQKVLGCSDWIVHNHGWAWILGSPFGFIFIIKILRRFRQARYAVDAIKLKLPIIGPLSGKISVTRWTRTLGTLISAGVPILDAINTSRATSGNEVYAQMLGRVHDSIRQGETFAGPLRQSKTVDLIVSNMVSVGEETGDLDKMLAKIADNYDEQIDVMVGSLMSLLEPMLIMVLGVIVMTIVMAVFLPMIKIITSLSV